MGWCDADLERSSSSRQGPPPDPQKLITLPDGASKNCERRTIALYALRDYDGAARELERVPRLGPWGTVRSAACRAQLGDLRDAGRLIDQALAENPGFSPLQYARKGIAFEHAQDLEHVIVGLESAIAASNNETCKSRIG